MNSCCLSGRLTKDPESYAPEGSDYTKLSFSIANDDQSKRNQAGEYESVTSFFDCYYWTKNPKLCLEKMTKGSYVAIQTQVEQERWEQDGSNRSKVVFRVTGKFPEVQTYKGSGAAAAPVNNEAPVF